MNLKPLLRRLAFPLMIIGGITSVASVGVMALEDHKEAEAARVIKAKKAELTTQYNDADRAYRVAVVQEHRTAAKTTDSIACAGSTEELAKHTEPHIPNLTFLKYAAQATRDCLGDKDLPKRLAQHAHVFQDKSRAIDDQWRVTIGETRRVPKPTLDRPFP